MANKNWLCLVLCSVLLAAAPGCGPEQVTVIEAQGQSAQVRFREVHLEPYWTNDDMTLVPGERVDKVWLEPKSIYCLTSTNKLYRLDRDKGTIAWIKQPAEPPRVIRRPVEAEDKVLVIAHNVVKVYELTTGNLLQELALDFSANSDPAFDGERLFVADSVNRVVAIELATGVEIWSCRAAKAVSVQPAQVAGTLVAGSESGEVMAYDTKFGTSLWEEHFQTRGAILGKPVLTDGGYYVASSDSMLYCLRLSGDERWRYFGGAGLQTGLSLADGRVFQAVPGKGLVVLDAKDGAEVEGFQLADGRQYVGTINDRFYVLLEDGKIVSVDTQSGERLVELEVADFDFFLGDAKKPHIYLASSTGQFICLGQIGLGPR